MPGGRQGRAFAPPLSFHSHAASLTAPAVAEGVAEAFPIHSHPLRHPFPTPIHTPIHSQFPTLLQELLTMPITQDLNALTQQQFAALTAAQIQQLTPAEVAALDPTHCQWLSPTQTAALSGPHVSALSAQQIGLLTRPTSLSVSAAAALSPAQITAFKAWSGITAAWLGALTPSACAAVPPGAFSKLTRNDLKVLQPATVLMMTPAQCAALPQMGYLLSVTAAALNPDQIRAMSPTQIGAIGKCYVLNDAAVGALSAAQVKAIYRGFENIAAHWLNALQPDALAAIAPANIGKLSATCASGLTAATFCALSNAQIAGFTAVASLSASVIGALRPDQIAVLPAIQTLGAAAIAALSPAQVAALTSGLAAVDATWINALSRDTLAALPASLISSIATAAISGLSAATLSHLTAAQLAVLPSPELLSAEAAAVRAAALAPSDFSVVDAAWLNAQTPATLAAIAAADLAKLPVATIAGLSAATVGALSPAQVAALPRLDTLSLAAVAILTPAQTAALTVRMNAFSADWVNALSPQAISAIAPAVLEPLSKAAVRLLSPAAAAALTPAQIRVMDCVSYLSPAATTVLSAAQAQCFLPWELERLGLANLAAPALAAIAPNVIAKLAASTTPTLTASVIAAMTPQQIAALPALGTLAPAAVAALSPAQVGALPSGLANVGAAWINALSRDTLASLPASVIGSIATAAIPGLSAATVSGLTAAQMAALPSPGLLSPEAAAARSGVLMPVNFALVDAAWLNAQSPATIAAISAANIARLSIATVQGLTATTVSALSPAQVAAITRLDKLSAAATPGLEADDIRALTPANIASLAFPGALSPAAVGALSAAQVAALPESTLNTVGGGWIRALSASGLAGVAFDKLTALVIRGFGADVISRMNGAQFASLANPEWIQRSAVASIRPDQLRQVTDWDSVSAAWLNALTPEAFAAIPAAGINQMSLAALQGLDAARRTIALKGADATHAGYLAMASGDASLNYDSVLAVLQDMQGRIGVDGLSTEQFASLNNILARSKAVDGTQSYVSSLLTSMVREGLKATMSADAFKASVDEWFLGVRDVGDAATTDLSDRNLFNGSKEQAAAGVIQGNLGDCGIISALVELATIAPERLSGLISANGNGTYAIKFYNNGAPFFVTVDSSVGVKGASMVNGNWVRLMEDAVAKACSDNLLTGMWGSLEGNGPYTTQNALTGSGYVNYRDTVDTYAKVVAALEDKSGLVTYISFKDSTNAVTGATELVRNHCFSVIGIDADGDYIFRNPWNSSLTFDMSKEEVVAVAGEGYFSITEMKGDYGSSAVQSLKAGPDSAALVQAMSAFDIPPAAATATTASDEPQPLQVALLTPH